ncbi:hypothetical protein [Arvimicrobium flavum]|uniref:hypothetical protein n=1 Tax=Arvimicrobium flavum TaxID=3393320 RepID=UPI00237A5610|nr:hypothetical protein [Mesorhizobium shangrilense]
MLVGGVSLLEQLLELCGETDGTVITRGEIGYLLDLLRKMRARERPAEASDGDGRGVS